MRTAVVAIVRVDAGETVATKIYENLCWPRPSVLLVVPVGAVSVVESVVSEVSVGSGSPSVVSERTTRGGGM